MAYRWQPDLQPSISFVVADEMCRELAYLRHLHLNPCSPAAIDADCEDWSPTVAWRVGAINARYVNVIMIIILRAFTDLGKDSKLD